jgi:hypothetical protein
MPLAWIRGGCLTPTITNKCCSSLVCLPTLLSTKLRQDALHTLHLALHVLVLPCYLPDDLTQRLQVFIPTMVGDPLKGDFDACGESVLAMRCRVVGFTLAPVTLDELEAQLHIVDAGTSSRHRPISGRYGCY